MLVDECCPYCGSESYNTDDYDEFYDTDEVSFYWRCDCNECKKTFHVTKWYKLIDTSVRTQEEFDGLE